MALYGELCGTLTGRSDDRSPLVLLHGLTFDRRQWSPLMRELEESGAGRQVLALDLPGHGESPHQSNYRAAFVASLVNESVTAAGLDAPVLVGHSIGAVIATEYVARYPARAAVNLDQPLLPGPFGTLVRQAEPTLRGPGWRAFWDRLLAGMGIESLSPESRALVAQTSSPRADLLLGYWDEILHRTDADIAEQRGRDLAAIAARGIGYRWITASEPPAPYVRWLTGVLPGVEITVLPGGHFPHLAHPGELAKLLT